VGRLPWVGVSRAARVRRAGKECRIERGAGLYVRWRAGWIGGMAQGIRGMSRQDSDLINDRCDISSIGRLLVAFTLIMGETQE
jgi:hypothetical protein